MKIMFRKRVCHKFEAMFAADDFYPYWNGEIEIKQRRDIVLKWRNKDIKAANNSVNCGVIKLLKTA